MIDPSRVAIYVDLNEVVVDGVRMRLGYLQIELLNELMKAKDVVSHEFLARRIDDIKFLRRHDGQSNTNQREALISSMRRRLAATALRIKNVYGEGYRLELEPA